MCRALVDATATVASCPLAAFISTESIARAGSTSRKAFPWEMAKLQNTVSRENELRIGRGQPRGLRGSGRSAQEIKTFDLVSLGQSLQVVEDERGGGYPYVA